MKIMHPSLPAFKALATAALTCVLECQRIRPKRLAQSQARYPLGGFCAWSFD